MDVTGPYLNGPGPAHPRVHVLSGADDAERTVNYWADEGVTSYKALYADHPRRTAARDRHRRTSAAAKITAHLCSVTYREAVDMGIDDLEHGFFVATDFVKDKQPDECPEGAGSHSLAALDPKSPGREALMRILIDHHVALTSTLTVFETFVPSRPRRRRVRST